MIGGAMDLTLTNGRKVLILKDGFGRCYIAEDDTYLRYNRATNQIMADAAYQDGEFVSLDHQGDFVVWRPPSKYLQN